MKKYILTSVLSVAALAATISCDRDHDTETVVQQTNSQDLPVAYDFQGVNFVKQNNNLYSYNRSFKSALNTGDVVLVYKQVGTDSGAPVWNLLPKTYYFNTIQVDDKPAALDYTFDFTKNDVSLYANSNFDMTKQDVNFQSTYLNGQNFRVVVIPGTSGGTVAGKTANVINTANYNEVAKYYGITTVTKL